MVNLVCSDPLHASRSAQPGWAETLGVGSQNVTGLLCQACASDPAGAHQQRAADQAAVAVAESSIATAAADALDGLRTLRDSTGTLTGAQLSTACRLLARVCIALIRLQLRRLDATT